jgi:ribosomal protein S18 acetylase RimI-like enzyme
MGREGADTFELRNIPAGDPSYLDALQLALTSRLREHAGYDRYVMDLVGQHNSDLILNPVVGLFADGRLIFAVAGLQSGGSVHVAVPWDRDVPAAGAEVIRLVLIDSRADGAVYAHTMAPARPSKWDESLRKSGFFRLTDLLYLLRPQSAATPPRGRSPMHNHAEWISYSTDVEPVFCDAIAQSYCGSLDCPELQDLRTPKQSLNAHRSVGVFDSQTWFVLVVGGRPLGVLLMSRVPHAPLMEIVYMGVSQGSRRTGVATILMDRAVHVAARFGASLILAVDERNQPARRLYERFGFECAGRRSAWIAKFAAGEC